MDEVTRVIHRFMNVSKLIQVYVCPLFVWPDLSTRETMACYDRLQCFTASLLHYVKHRPWPMVLQWYHAKHPAGRNSMTSIVLWKNAVITWLQIWRCKLSQSDSLTFLRQNILSSMAAVCPGPPNIPTGSRCWKQKLPLVVVINQYEEKSIPRQIMNAVSV